MGRLRSTTGQPTRDEVFTALLLMGPGTATELARDLRCQVMTHGPVGARRRVVRAVAWQLRALRSEGRVVLNRVVEPGRRLEWRALNRRPALCVLRTDAALAELRAALEELG